MNDDNSYLIPALIAFFVVGTPLVLLKVNWFLIAIIITIVELVVINVYESIVAKKSENKEYSLIYNEDTSTLTIRKRSPKNSNDIIIKNYTHTSYSYNPSKLIYTSATVGGVTTGGFDTTKASYSPTSQEQTDKYELYCGKVFIDKLIIPNEEDLKSAKNNQTLKKFYDKGNQFLLEHKVKSSLTPYERQMLQQAVLTNDYQTMSGLGKKDIIAKKLTYDECQSIKAWICGND